MIARAAPVGAAMTAVTTGVAVSRLGVTMAQLEVAMPVRRAESVTHEAKHHRGKREQRPAHQTRQKEGCHLGLDLCGGVPLVRWGVNRMYGRRGPLVAPVRARLACHHKLNDVTPG